MVTECVLHQSPSFTVTLEYLQHDACLCNPDHLPQREQDNLIYIQTRTDRCTPT